MFLIHDYLYVLEIEGRYSQKRQGRGRGPEKLGQDREAVGDGVERSNCCDKVSRWTAIILGRL